MSKEVSLWVNEECIPIDYFVSGFIDHTVGGVVASLRGTSEIRTLELSIDGSQVTINLNNAQIPVNEFASKIIGSTITGMVSTLKGVRNIKGVKIAIKR
ncbi:MAG: hypothetical protein ABSG44_19165 [Thermodesulfobacteriota bacterium]|jgi:hypothetical protein